MRRNSWQWMPTGLLAAGVLALTTATPLRAQEMHGHAMMQDQHQILMRVSGMSCDECRQRLEKGLREVSGVDSVAVSVEKGEAWLWVRQDAAIADSTLTRIATDLGFKAEGIERRTGGSHAKRKP